jgi:hypothetical protein
VEAVQVTLLGRRRRRIKTPWSRVLRKLIVAQPVGNSFAVASIEIESD